ncbi:hypothetical protein N7490_011431 [Penicillium lividum]|nr:hypothetical protein N7490_011431 [Penicillium lividum]
MRSAFRSPHAELDPTRIANTIRFLERATEIRGLEHKILKNLMLARYWENPPTRETRVLKSLGLFSEEERLRNMAYEHYNLTLQRLNESLGTCLK